jgi:hypothetical protein
MVGVAFGVGGGWGDGATHEAKLLVSAAKMNILMWAGLTGFIIRRLLPAVMR